MKALPRISLAAVAAFSLAGSVSGQSGASGCLSILTPRPGTFLTQPACTVRTTGCGSVVSVTAVLQYTLADGVTQQVAPLGTAETPPYTISVVLHTIPDQLVTGMAVVAQALLQNGQTVSARNEGIFFLKDQAPPPQIDIPSHDGLGRLSASRIEMHGPNPPVGAVAALSWDRHHLYCEINVADTSFTSSLSVDQRASMGIEILLDPSASPLPYPGDSVIAFDIPLSGKPARRTYRPVFGIDGTYKLTVQARKQDLPLSVETRSGKGWRLLCSLPMPAGLAASQTLRCNIVVKPTAGVDSARFAWASSAGATYAPVRWGTITLAGGGFFAGSLWIWMVSFGAAFLGSAVIGFFAILRRRRVRQMSMRRTVGVPEEHREILEKIRALIEAKVTDRTASLESAAAELSLPGPSINRLCKRHFGWQFQQCLLLSRTEVARERLRSSNAPEKSIASMCGFGDETEMEKCFVKFYRTTPAKYRQEQQVT